MPPGRRTITTFATPIWLAKSVCARASLHPLHVKRLFNWVASVGNDSAKEPIDRFRTGHAFNSASMLRGALSLLYPLDHWWLEVDYAQWLWGRGARVYREPFASLSYDF